MKTVVFGAHGFVGSAVSQEMILAGHEVLDGLSPETGERVDLVNAKVVEQYSSITKPEIVINCAGIVSGSEEDFENNVNFTRNILNGIKEAGINVKRVIIRFGRRIR